MITTLPPFRSSIALPLLLASMACVSPGNSQVQSSPAQTPAKAAATAAAVPLPGRSTRSQVPAALETRLFDLWRTFPGKTGIAVRRIDGDWSLSHRGDQYFPQQSVSKLWVALTLLDKVDQGKVSLDDEIRIGPEDLTLFHQPMAARVKRDGEIVETVRSLLDQAITRSDNSANDALLRHAGGPDAVRDFIARNNLGQIRFGPGERLLQSQIAGIEWRQYMSEGRAFQAERSKQSYEARRKALYAYLKDPIDGASPDSITNALAKLARGELLSEESTRLILNVMSRTRSGPKRLKGGVPTGWQFAHKTGTGQVLPPISTGYNDIGIMTAPDGTRYAVVVMLADTTAPIPERMTLMQNVSRAVANTHRP
ncbi:serine hydrolase [Alterisphingorhabdus coralli]|uniref:beta-lactamase n=1 Tax=Alterisphingorhabdus coralli TaxID=3071408 RepID=A0AA97I1Z4_9SPHN|nr:serine hydrolase [Parasphingorhabdus sp. SCSIO 66989]WOE75783.1 serine hydrolase [Parasphingorhabdus sp. SCSIO 66989]